MNYAKVARAQERWTKLKRNQIRFTSHSNFDLAVRLWLYEVSSKSLPLCCTSLKEVSPVFRISCATHRTVTLIQKENIEPSYLSRGVLTAGSLKNQDIRRQNYSGNLNDLPRMKIHCTTWVKVPPFWEKKTFFGLRERERERKVIIQMD